MRTTTIYTLVQATRDMSIMFIGTTYAPFLKSIGLSNAQITVINWVFAGLMLLAQVPTGVFADKCGRALSIKIGLGVLLLGHYAYYFASGFWSALAIEGAVGIGIAFVSGADQAWLTSRLNAEGDGKKLEAAFGTTNSVSFAACLVSGALGAVIGARDLRLPWIACGLVGIVPLVVAIAFMREPPRSPPPEGQGTGQTAENPANASWRLLRGSYDLKWCIVAICVLAFATPFFHYWPLVYRERAGSFGMSAIWIVIYAPKILGAVAMRLWSGKLANGWGVMTMSCALAVTGVGLYVAGASATLATLLVGTLAMEFALGFFQPLTSAFVQRRVPDEKCRATYGSLQSLIAGSWSIVVMIGIASAMAMRPDDNPSILSLWREMGFLMLVAAIPVIALRPKNQKTSKAQIAHQDA